MNNTPRWTWLMITGTLLLFSAGCYTCGEIHPCNPFDPGFSLQHCRCQTAADCPGSHSCNGGLCQQTSDGVLQPDGSTTEQPPDPSQEPPPERITPVDVPPDVTECQSGESKACYTGPPQTQGVGPCTAGIASCIDGRWGACSGQILPQAESCNGKDDDCDGQTDEDVTLSCYNGPQETLGKGTCRAGTAACVDGAFDVDNCKGSVTPQKEVCDGKDNDCNGQIDDTEGGCPCQKDGETQSCYGGPAGTETNAPCKAGTQTCAQNQWGKCVGQVLPKANEACNGIDDDCDGDIDEKLQRTCKSSCGEGQETCSKGSWSACSAPTPKAETCNNKDDDCDGAIDEKLERACQADCGGLKVQGTQSCSKGSWSPCAAQTSQETCNGKDDDCDGDIDEKLQRACYGGSSSTRGKGLCKDGTETCSRGRWGSCIGDVLPTTETCNNKDDDCDGDVDEGGVCSGCTPGTSRPCGSDVGACTKGTQECRSSRTWGACSGGTSPRAEACNGIDDDCDGFIDENNPQSGPSCTLSGLKGPCRDGELNCRSGRLRCDPTYSPKAETCNGIDDDCDGATDEGLTRGCSSACGSGTESCSGGQWGGCTAPQPQTEICDGKDTDCDGNADACTSGQKRCKNNNVEICKKNCEGWDQLQSCTAANPCNNGACCVCTPGATRCNSGNAETCKSDCSGWTVTTCTGSCVSGRCCACTPGALRCFGPRVQQCNPDCTGWSTYDDCLKKGQDCQNNACVPIQ